jgi:tRNA(Leu) C34 or U34 (ribose-2'-O)-methylase TrmL
LRLALFEPDIPQNAGALLRLAGCFGVAVDLIEPCGFLLDDRRLKRAVLDMRLISFCAATSRGRLSSPVEPWRRG